jgi:hypothetical protein
MQSILPDFLVLDLATGATGRSATVAALFAVHPLNTETVNYVNCRSSLLVSSFIIVSLYGFVRSIFKRSWPWQVFSVICFGIGFLVKEEAIVVIALALVLDFLFLWSQTRGDVGRRFLYHYLPFLVVIGIYFLYRRAVLDI